MKGYTRQGSAANADRGESPSEIMLCLFFHETCVISV